MTTSGLTAFVWCKSDGVVNPKVARSTGCGASSLRFLHFWPCILVQGPVEERKKNPELVTGVITSSLDYSQLFPIPPLSKEKGVPRQCATEEGLVVRTRVVKKKTFFHFVFFSGKKKCFFRVFSGFFPCISFLHF